jgi:hypothetical protein
MTYVCVTACKHGIGYKPVCINYTVGNTALAFPIDIPPKQNIPAGTAFIQSNYLHPCSAHASADTI